jgi:hypothetical protein
VKKIDPWTRFLGWLGQRLTRRWLRRMARLGRFPEVAAVRIGPSRNDLCPCKSGKKYKVCCGRPAQ